MKFLSISKRSAFAAVILPSCCAAFTTSPVWSSVTPPTLPLQVSSGRSSAVVATASAYRTKHAFLLRATSSQEEVDDEIERLKQMAAKLRAEAASLEAEQQATMAKAAEKAFQKFDLDNDGKVTLEELKLGLEKTFKLENLSEKRVAQLMRDFDTSGDGALQLDEFVGVDLFKNKLDDLSRKEKALAKEKQRAADLEQEAAKLIQAQMDFINDREPSTSDKVISILPYLFPLLDGIQFGKFLIVDNAENPASLVLAVCYGLYRSIPFGGFIAFIALNFLSGNPTINRLIRFNMQQAIFLDIALFFPGLIGALATLVAPGSIPVSLSAVGSNVIFVTLLIVLAYTTISSLLGITPNKIPLISENVENRMPTVDMFDAKGNFLPRAEREKKREKKRDENKDKKD